MPSSFMNQRPKHEPVRHRSEDEQHILLLRKALRRGRFLHPPDLADDRASVGNSPITDSSTSPTAKVPMTPVLDGMHARPFHSKK